MTSHTNPETHLPWLEAPPAKIHKDDSPPYGEEHGGLRHGEPLTAPDSVCTCLTGVGRRRLNYLYFGLREETIRLAGWHIAQVQLCTPGVVLACQRKRLVPVL